MAFPTITTITHSAIEPASTTSHTVTLPASIASGDLIIAMMFKDAQGTATIPSPWVEIKDVNTTTAHFYVAYLIASGGETTVTITSSVSEKAQKIAIRIAAANWHGTTPPEISTSSAGLDTAPDPDAVTASWGSDDNLFIAIAAGDINTVINGFPTNYTGNQTVTENPGTSSGNGGFATRELAAASDNPGTFSQTVSEDWMAATMVVRPAAGGGGGTSPPHNLMTLQVGR